MKKILRHYSTTLRLKLECYGSFFSKPKGYAIEKHHDKHKSIVVANKTIHRVNKLLKSFIQTCFIQTYSIKKRNFSGKKLQKSENFSKMKKLFQ